MKPLLVYSRGVRPLRNGNISAKAYPFWDQLIALLAPDFEIVEVVKEPLDELEKLLKRAKYVVACDSFLQHFCWYIGVKCITLWGTSDPLIFGHEENINLLKNRGYLRPNQFDMWEGDPVNPNAFVTPEEVLKAVSSYPGNLP